MKTAVRRPTNRGAVLPPRSGGRMMVTALATLLLLGQGPLLAGEVKGPRFVLAWGKKGDRADEFHSPIGVAISKKDEVYVTDLNNARLQRFTADGKYVGGFDLPW